MAYKLSLDQDLSKSAREALASQVRKAVERLDRAGRLEPLSPEAVVALHDARRNLKKARSLLRLLRSSLPRAVYRREMDALRDCARAVAESRDADALLGALHDLRERYAGDVPAGAFTRLEESLAQRAGAARAYQGERLTDAAERLGAGLGRLEDLPTAELTIGKLLRQLRRSYASGRADARRARTQPTVEDLHEWRKRVKDLWYQERLVQAVWPELLELRNAQAHRLSDLLGEDHDLALLLELLREGDQQGEPPAFEGRELITLLERRRTQLQSRATLLGSRIYAERPKAYERRMAALVRTVRLRGQADDAGEHGADAREHGADAREHGLSGLLPSSGA